MRRRFFTARDGLRLSALEWDGPEEALPLLCLPGLSRTALDYVSTAERHPATRRVVALDYAGHGESAKAPLARYTIPNTLGDVLDCMAALRVPRAVVIGTSLGGLLGMVLSVLRPGALAGLVLNDSGPRIDAGGLSGAREVIGSDPRLGSIEECIAYLRRLLPETGIPDDRWIDAAETTYWRGEDGRYRPRWDTGLIQALPKSGSGPTELWPMFEALPDVPVLLIWGEASLVLSAATVAGMQRRRPDLQVLALPGIGHSPWLGIPAVAARIDGFVSGLR